jgi:hypothetical protein
MSAWCHKRLVHRSKGIFDRRVGTGGQACFAEILGDALVSTLDKCSHQFRGRLGSHSSDLF